MDATTKVIFPPGIYFGLDADLYHADSALGSTDIRMLRRNPTSYWERRINPLRKEKRTDALERGAAMHSLIFDGEAKFTNSYTRGPDQDGMSQGEKTASTKRANADAAASGRVCLKADDYDRVILAHAIIRLNPDMAGAFTGGFPELSVFWTRDGVRRKARFDYLKVLGVSDLKGCENANDRDFWERTKLEIAWRGYNLQMVHYLEARAAMPQLFDDGAVNGDHDSALLRKICIQPICFWTWVFYCTVGTPDACAWKISPGNTPQLENSKLELELATCNFKMNTAQFGDDKWVIKGPPRELLMEDMPWGYSRITPDELDIIQKWRK